MQRFGSLLCALFLLTAGCGGDEEPATPETPTNASPAFQKEGTVAFMRERDTLTTIDVEVADNEAGRRRGLMERLALPSGSGMIFLMERNEPQGFWMRNTPMALDILFANADSQIVRVAKNTTPYSQETVKSGAPAKFVVEVPAGYTTRRGIVEGDRIRFRRIDARPGGAVVSAGSRSE